MTDLTGTETSTDSINDDLEAAFGSETTTDAADVSTAVATAEPSAPGGEAQALEVPKHWSEVDRSLFSKAPPDIQKRWLDRDKEYRRGFDEKAQALAKLQRSSGQFDELFAPYDQDLQLRGADRTSFVRSLLGAHDFLRRDPQAGIKWLAEQYGVDLSALNEQQEQVDPRFDQLSKGYKDLASKVNGFATAQQQAAHQENLGRVHAFADAKDASGNPAHPHFDEVAEDVLTLIKSGVRDLDVAYNKALRMNDEVWSKVTAEREAAKSKQADAQRKADIDKAKRAGVTSVAKERPNGATKESTLKDELEQSFASWQP